MDWYKTSKMIDISPDVVAKKFVLCPKCSKWGTSLTGNMDDVEWKRYPEMNPGEQREMNNAKSLFEEGLLTYEIVSCDECRA